MQPFMSAAGSAFYPHRLDSTTCLPPNSFFPWWLQGWVHHPGAQSLFWVFSSLTWLTVLLPWHQTNDFTRCIWVKKTMSQWFVYHFHIEDEGNAGWGSLCMRVKCEWRELLNVRGKPYEVLSAKLQLQPKHWHPLFWWRETNTQIFGIRLNFLAFYQTKAEFNKLQRLLQLIFITHHSDLTACGVFVWH